jgi:TRAP-type C4-dicarboxylate transport system substrate-binding protein
MKKSGNEKGLTRRDFIGKTGKVIGGAIVAGSVAGPLIKVSPASASGEYKMVLAHSFPNFPTLMENGLFKFKEVAERESGGKLVVELHGGDELGAQEKTPQKVAMGAIQACNLSPQNFSNFVEEYNVIDFPFMFKSMDIFRYTMESPALEQGLHGQVQKRGWKVLKYEPTGFRGLGQGKKVPQGVRVPEDISKLKVRVTASKIEQQSFAMAGANPTPMAWGECFTGMQTGAIDALNVGIAPLYVTQIYETFKYWTPINFMMNANMTIMNLQWYQSLPDPMKEVIAKATKESVDYQYKLQETNNAMVAMKYLEAGIQWVQPNKSDYEKWYAKLGHQISGWDDWKKRVGTSLYENIVAVTQEAEKAAATKTKKQ